MTETEIVWGAPPPRSGAIDWADRLALLRERPGEWAAIASFPIGGQKATSAASFIKRGLYAGGSAGEFETTTRTIDGETKVFARYVGGVAS